MNEDGVQDKGSFSKYPTADKLIFSLNIDVWQIFPLLIFCIFTSVKSQKVKESFPNARQHVTTAGGGLVKPQLDDVC